MIRGYFVYILASDRNGSLYVGVTNDLPRRVYQHRTKVVPSFTTEYNIGRLVWYEVHKSIEVAISREKRVKRWRRRWKLELIETENPGWVDLFDSLSS